MSEKLQYFKTTLFSGQDCVNFLLKNPDIITTPLENGQSVYKVYFTEALEKSWDESLIRLTNCLLTLDSCDEILIDPSYLYMLQSSSKNHTDLFEFFIVNTNITVGDLTFLVRSLVARGELPKFKILQPLYDLTKITGLLELALRYGRIEMLEYLVTDLDLTVKPDLVNLVQLEDDPKYLYYRSSLARIDPKQCLPVENSRQDYKSCLSRVAIFPESITSYTLERWSELCQYKVYPWDEINYADILSILEDRIPTESKKYLLRDNDTQVSRYCKHLERELRELQYRYGLLCSRLNIPVDI